MEVKWLQRALKDLDTIATFIQRDNAEAARVLIQSIRDKTARLSDFPYMGRAGEKTDVREFFVHEHYLVSYRIRPEKIEMLQVWHTAQDRRAQQ